MNSNTGTTNTNTTTGPTRRNGTVAPSHRGARRRPGAEGHCWPRVEVTRADHDGQPAAEPCTTGTWAAVVAAYVRAQQLTGLVADLLTDVGFTVTTTGSPSGEAGCVVTPAVTRSGEPLVRIAVTAAEADRLHQLLDSHPPPDARAAVDGWLPGSLPDPAPARVRAGGRGTGHHAA